MVFLKFGFQEWLKRIRFGKVLAGLKLRPRPRPDGCPDPDSIPVHPSVFDQARLEERSSWERLRMALEVLGPTFVKFGQIMSNRSDVLPPGLIVELTKLQDQVPPFPSEQALAMVRTELGDGTERLFSEFNPVPVASASIAQVHEGWLADGCRVAIKIQRPNIEPVILRDLEILAYLARLVERHVPELRHFDPEGMVAEFRRQMLRELDFTLEKANMERFAQCFRGDKRIHVPRSMPHLCSRRVLTMEYVQGIKLGSILEHRLPVQVDRQALADNLAALMLDQVFTHGFFHADPHPGNVMVLPGNKACFLDFGMMGRIHPEEQKNLIDLLSAMPTRNYRHITQSLLHLVGQSSHDVPDLELEIADLLDVYFDRPLGEIDFGELFQRLVLLVQGHNLKIPSKFLLLAKTMVISEGIGSQLSPEFSLLAYFEPFAAKMAMRQLEPERLAKLLLGKAEAYTELVQEFPLETREVLRLLKNGELSINFRLRGVEPLKESVEHTGTRLVFGLVLAAILISSSLMIRANVPPLVYGIPIIGLIGFGIAGIMSFGFLISIIKGLWHKPGKGA